MREDLDACLECGYNAMVDRKALLEVLIQGTVPQAMSVVEAFGFEGVEACSSEAGKPYDHPL